jgi:hypothetical protein
MSRIELSKYPECDKLAKIGKESYKLGEFIDWLREDGIIFCEWVKDYDYPVQRREDTEHLLARYFKIDLDLVEKERGQLLEELRKR